MWGRLLLRRLKWDRNQCLFYVIAGCPLLRGFECIEVYGDTVRIFRNVCYIASVRYWGVSIKWGSTVHIVYRAVGSKFNLVRPSAYDGRNCDQMALQAATGGGCGRGMCSLLRGSYSQICTWKYQKMPLQPAIQRVKCLLRMPNKQCNDPLLKDRQKLVRPWLDWPDHLLRPWYTCIMLFLVCKCTQGHLKMLTWIKDSTNDVCIIFTTCLFENPNQVVVSSCRSLLSPP